MHSDHKTSRRQFVAGAALAGAMSVMPSLVGAQTADDAIRPFKVAIPDADIVAMKRRIAETRWADTEPAPDENASGNTPSINASDVIMMGLKRNLTASMVDSITSIPQSTRSLANSTIRMAFFAASPINVTNPI